MIFSKKASVQWKVDDWFDLNSKQEGVRLVGFKYQKGYDWLDLNSKQEGVRLVRFKYQKGYDWLNSQFHCSHLDSRGVPEKPREKKRGKLSPFHFRFTTSGDVISGDATSGRACAHDHFRWRHDPHRSPTNARWMVLLYYSWRTRKNNFRMLNRSWR